MRIHTLFIHQMLHLQDAGISVVFAISYFSGGVASAVYSSDNADFYEDNLEFACDRTQNDDDEDFCSDFRRVRNSEGASAVSYYYYCLLCKTSYKEYMYKHR